MKFGRYFAILICALMLGTALGAAQSTNPSTTPSVITSDATSITTSSAQLNGSLVSNGGSFAGWFLWGTTTSLGQRTDPQIFSDGSTSATLVASLGKLNPHTTYY